MGYESLSTVVVLVVVVLILAVWLPRRTANGMKRVMEHRGDRYSSSLHLVDADSGTKFSDVRTPQAKGAIMQPTQPQRTTAMNEHIAQVRRMRRAAARRRAIIASALLAATILVAVLAVVLHFSPWFTLIPAALLAAVVALGANAARHARAWERKVAERRKKGAGRPAGPSAVQASKEETRRVEAADLPTESMAQSDIRRVLEEAEREKARAEGRRHADVVDVESVVVEERADADDRILKQDAAAVVPVQGAVEQPMPQDDADVETERTQDAAGAPDLISFSLGTPRDGYDAAPAAPESLEIRSTRQVAKAVPQTPADEDGEDVTDAVEPNRTVTDAQVEPSFHEAEVVSEVDAPAASGDSLGTGLDAILARRGA